MRAIYLFGDEAMTEIQTYKWFKWKKNRIFVKGSEHFRHALHTTEFYFMCLYFDLYYFGSTRNLLSYISSGMVITV